MASQFRSKNRFVPSLECLEGRLTPAGNVVVSSTASLITAIVGDAGDNEIKISPGSQPNLFKIEGLNGTMLNGANLPLEQPLSQAVAIKMKGGNDNVIIYGNLAFQQSLAVNGGTGDNYFSANLGTLAVGGSFSITNPGRAGRTFTNTVIIGDQPGDVTQIGGSLIYSSPNNPNADVVSIGSVYNRLEVGGPVQINLGGGSNNANIVLNNVAPDLTVTSSSQTADTSTISLSAQNVTGDVSAKLGNGAATTFNFNANYVFGNLIVNTGANSKNTNINMDVSNQITNDVTVNNLGRETKTTLTTATILGTVNVRSMGTYRNTVAMTAITSLGSVNVTTGIGPDEVYFDDVNLNDANVITGRGGDAVRVDVNQTPGNGVSNLNGNVVISTGADVDFVLFGIRTLNVPQPDRRVNIYGTTYLDGGTAGPSYNSYGESNARIYGGLTVLNFNII